MDSVDVVNEVTTGEYKNVEASDPIFQQGPQAPLCDLRNIPAACVPERMSGLTDQERCTFTLCHAFFCFLVADGEHHRLRSLMVFQEVADVRLAQAATRGELKDIEQALRAGARVDTRAELHIAMGDASGSKPGKRTPLMRAAASGHLEVVKTLIRAGASIWRVDSRGWTSGPPKGGGW
eukprot:g23896.t3